VRVLLLSALLVTTAACTSGPRSELASDMPPPFAPAERAAPEMTAPEMAGPEMAGPAGPVAAPPQVASAPIPLTPMAPPPPGPEAMAPQPAQPMPPQMAEPMPPQMAEPMPPQMASEAPATAAPQAPAAPFGSLFGTPAPRRLTLSNFSFDKAHVVAVATASPDCTTRLEGDNEANFELPLNGTRIIEVPPGRDVCWRREIEPMEPGAGRRWSAWNRAFVSVAGSIDSRL
jgi:hypothetical protein